MPAGRPKGSKNKRTLAQIEAVKAKNGELPLDYMLRVMSDENADQSRRDDMAKAAAPYLHARLQSTTIKGDDDQPVKMQVELVTL